MAKEKDTSEVVSTKNAAPFTQEQFEIVQQMIQQARNENKSSINSVSMYNQRDPKSIESVNVKRIDGKFVVAWKNWQNDPLKKTPKWLVYKPMPERGLTKEPFITVILSNDGVDFEEKEMPLIDYMTDREYYKAPCIKVDVKKIIEDHGYLGSSGEYAVAVDSKGMPEARPMILAQTEREERVFTVELPGFAKPVEFIADYLA